MLDIGRILILAGLIVVVLGIIISFSDRIPLLGKLPGDIMIKRDNFTFYFPLTTSIILSIVLSIILRLFSK
jgi:hypothetical protein